MDDAFRQTIHPSFTVLYVRFFFDKNRIPFGTAVRTDLHATICCHRSKSTIAVTAFVPRCHPSHAPARPRVINHQLILLRPFRRTCRTQPCPICKRHMPTAGQRYMLYTTSMIAIAVLAFSVHASHAPHRLRHGVIPAVVVEPLGSRIPRCFTDVNQFT